MKQAALKLAPTASEREQFYNMYLGRLEDRILARPEEAYDTDILVYGPQPDRPFYTLVSSGLSDYSLQIPLDEDEEVQREFSHVELLLYLNEFDSEDREDSWPVHFMRAMTAFPHLCEAWIPPGLVVPNGFPPRPIMEESQLCAAFFVPPVLEPRGFQEGLLLADGCSMTCLVLDFITKRELDFYGQYGAQALGSLFLEKRHSPAVDPYRTSYL